MTLADRVAPAVEVAVAPVSAQPIPVAALAAMSEQTRPGNVIRAYVSLTKPRIVELLLVPTVPAMFLAQRRFSPLWLTLVVLVGGAPAPAAPPAPDPHIHPRTA